MSQGKVLRSLTKHKWRHSTYVTDIHNLYVRDSSSQLPIAAGGLQDGRAVRQKIEFYSRLCGKVIQHLQKQRVSPNYQNVDTTRWVYSGLFFAVVHNLKDIHQKDIVVLLSALVKLLRAEHRRKNDFNALIVTVEGFLTSLMICSDHMITCVQRIAQGTQPTMHKWKYFANLMRAVTEKYKRSSSQNAMIHDRCNGDPPEMLEEAPYEHDVVPNEVNDEYDITACLAKEPSNTLFAHVMERSAKLKDFARLASVLYWLHHLGFPHETTKFFFHMLLNKMLSLGDIDHSETYPRDIISVLRYSFPFQIDSRTISKLYGYLSQWNKESILQLNLQDVKSLLECLLDTECFDQGLLVAIFTNLQLSLEKKDQPHRNSDASILHCYLSEKNRGETEEYALWDQTFMDFPALNHLAETFIAKDALIHFLRKHGCTAFYGRTQTARRLIHDEHIWNDIVAMLQTLSPTLEETKPYCLALIDHLTHTVVIT
ncbi:hypothetical protein BgAZ_402270 [Babesia gibsoni]|uniref:Uncharacterized protein n=1 Tax=Babesia gibsoni TaxID=33632 RepID=A0AAD8LPW5_BABGI|nr:hypothetical protein BgAZ_402270 [Babesia gibsoni]